jgi:hypothetical protein
MSLRTRACAALVLAGVAAGCATTTSGVKPATPVAQAAAPAPARELPERSELPMVIRETLSASMERHGEELSFLLVSVVLLDYVAAEQLAQLIANEPRLGRPGPDEKETLNALLPSSFFVHQDQLLERANALALAARAKNDATLGKAFGALAETCVGCHSTYLHDELEALRSARY